MNVSRGKIWSLATGLLLVGGMIAVALGAAERTSAAGGKWEEKLCVVLDAGHGGDDPGKIGWGDVLEKDINLSITRKVKAYLESAGIRVVLTRKDENGLYPPDGSNKKVKDMKERIRIMEESAPAAVVSIHQNSFPEEYVHGAQVFYYETSDAGRGLAEKLQSSLDECLKPESPRAIKANDSYYLLKKTRAPIVIVECGFLSNPKEAQMLCDEDYQDRVAWAIQLGIQRYLAQWE